MENAAGATDGPGGAVESRQDSVPGRVDLAAAQSSERAPEHDVIALQEIAASAVAEPDGQLGRAHDVDEQHRGQHAVGVRGWVARRSDLVDPVGDGVGLPGTEEAVLARQVEELRPGDSLGLVAGLLATPEAVDDMMVEEECISSLAIRVVGGPGGSVMRKW
jgi:hypothetical protein